MTDYVVTRKRKRYAVDPCLGYYMYAPSNEARVNSLPRISSNVPVHGRQGTDDDDTLFEKKRGDESTRLGLGLEDHESVHQHQLSKRGLSYSCEAPPSSLLSAAQSREEGVLSVESFLKRSTKRHAIKTYQRRRIHNRRAAAEQVAPPPRSTSIIRRSSTTADDNEPECSSGCADSKRKDRRRRGKRTKKTLRQRLYEAAVSTHSHPDDFYARSESVVVGKTAGVSALVFVPDESRDHVVSPLHKKKALLVDPRKSMALKMASGTSWSSGLRRGYTESGGLLRSTLDQVPLSKWNLTSNQHGQATKSAPQVILPTTATTAVTPRKRAKKTGDMASKESFVYPPLRFVSFQEAENNYKTMFSGGGAAASSVSHPPPRTMADEVLSLHSAAPEGIRHKMSPHDCSTQLDKSPSETPRSGVLITALMDLGQFESPQ